VIAKEVSRKRRHIRLRKKISGTTERPRLCVFRSLNNICAQIIDDVKGVTIASASTQDKSIKGDKGHKGNIEAAKKIGALIAANAQKAGIKQVVFDRGGYVYHGRVKALADSAREAGLEF